MLFLVLLIHWSRWWQGGQKCMNITQLSWGHCVVHHPVQDMGYVSKLRYIHSSIIKLKFYYVLVIYTGFQHILCSRNLGAWVKYYTWSNFVVIFFQTKQQSFTIIRYCLWRWNSGRGRLWISGLMSQQEKFSMVKN